jgi:hypothetical protein
MFVPVRKIGRYNDVLLSLSQIHHVQQPMQGDSVRIVDLRGEPWLVDAEDIRVLANPIIHVLPAEKGTLVIFADQDKPDDKFILSGHSPVLGWIVRQDGDVQPTILGGFEGFNDDLWAIQHPNGEIEKPHEAYFGDEKTWLEYVNKRRRKPGEIDLIG